MNQQREVIYEQRREASGARTSRATIEEMIYEKAEEIAAALRRRNPSCPRTGISRGSRRGLQAVQFPSAGVRRRHPGRADLRGALGAHRRGVPAGLRREGDAIGEAEFRQLERIVMLQTVDNLWKDHLLSMDHLKEGIGLRGYAQQNPL
jgi:preprotein translocase subunit SecA